MASTKKTAARRAVRTAAKPRAKTIALPTPAMTRQQIYAKAVELGIEGASRWSKAELEHAVAKAERAAARRAAKPASAARTAKTPVRKRRANGAMPAEVQAAA